MREIILDPSDDTVSPDTCNAIVKLLVEYQKGQAWKEGFEFLQKCYEKYPDITEKSGTADFIYLQYLFHVASGEEEKSHKYLAILEQNQNLSRIAMFLQVAKEVKSTWEMERALTLEEERQDLVQQELELEKQKLESTQEVVSDENQAQTESFKFDAAGFHRFVQESKKFLYSISVSKMGEGRHYWKISADKVFCSTDEGILKLNAKFFAYIDPDIKYYDECQDEDTKKFCSAFKKGMISPDSLNKTGIKPL